MKIVATKDYELHKVETHPIASTSSHVRSCHGNELFCAKMTISVDVEEQENRADNGIIQASPGDCACSSLEFLYWKKNAINRKIVEISAPSIG